MELKQLFNQDSSLKAYEIKDVLKVEYVKTAHLFRVFLKTTSLIAPSVKEPVSKFLKTLTGKDCESYVLNVLEGDFFKQPKEALMGLCLGEPLKFNVLKEAVFSFEGNALLITHFSMVLVDNF